MITFKSIVESGLLKTDTYQKKRGIVLSNYISLILCGALAVLLTVRLSLRIFDEVTLVHFPIDFVLFLLPIVLNRFGFTTVSRLALCSFPVIMVWISIVTITKSKAVIPPTDYDSMRIFMLGLSFIPYLLLDRRQWPVFILGILPVFISIFFLQSIFQLVGMDPLQRGVPGMDYGFIQIRTIVSYLMLSTSCIVFQVIVMSNDKFNKRLLDELQEKTLEIEAQNEELIQGQESLNQINHHLERLVEERTQKIRNQNEILLKYAYTNAHHVRGPVARVLGLIELSRIKTDLDYAWFFEKVEHETKNIDQIIKRIGTELDNSETIR